MANTSWLFSDFILRQGLNIIVGVLVARYLQPAQYGKLAYATVYLQIFLPLALLGLNQLTIRELVKKEFRAGDILGTSFTLKLIASIFTFLLIIGITYYIENDYQLRLFITIASFSILLSPIQVIDFYFQANVESKYVVYSQQISSFLCGLIRITLVLLNYSLVYFVIIILIEVLIQTSILTLFYLSKNSIFKNWKFNISLAKYYGNEISHIMLSAFFVAIYVRIDQVMLRYLCDEQTLGIYTAAVKLSEPFYVVATLLVSSLFPAMVNGLKISEIEYKSRVQRLYDILLWIAIATSLVVTIFSSLIIDLIYGVNYHDSKSVLTIYFWASPFVFLGVVGGNTMLIEKKQKYTAIFTFGGAIINIILNFIFIPIWGVNGAAAATLISYAMASFFLNYLFIETRSIFNQQINAFYGLPRIYHQFKKFINSK